MTNTTETYNKMDEVILVAPRKQLFIDESLTFQGAISDPEKTAVIGKNLSELYETMRRGDAEENFDFKQPIGYAIIRRGNEVYMYERLSGGGEKRLHNKVSIGVGGHMNAVEGADNFADTMFANIERELEEELEITDPQFGINIFGFLNDDSDEVGRVHIGVLAMVAVEEDSEVTVRETDQLAGRWTTIEELKGDDLYPRLENWSKIVVDILK